MPRRSHQGSVSHAAARLVDGATLVVGFATRLSALALLSKMLMIQIFGYPEAQWPVRSRWAALALAPIARGAGMVTPDAPLARRSRR